MKYTGPMTGPSISGQSVGVISSFKYLGTFTDNKMNNNKIEMRTRKLVKGFFLELAQTFWKEYMSAWWKNHITADGNKNLPLALMVLTHRALFFFFSMPLWTVHLCAGSGNRQKPRDWVWVLAATRPVCSLPREEEPTATGSPYCQLPTLESAHCFNHNHHYQGSTKHPPTSLV